MQSRDELKHELAAIELKAAQLRAVYALKMVRPSSMYPVRVFLDGSRWVCIFDTHEDQLRCPMAYGESPRQATENFDALWDGAADFLVDQEEEEEQF